MISLKEAVFNALVNAKANGYATFLAGPSAEIAADLIGADSDVALAVVAEHDMNDEAWMQSVISLVDEWKRNLA